MNGGSALGEQCFFFVVQLEIDNLFATVFAQDNRNADADVRFSVFTFQVNAARNQFLLVVDDRFYYKSSSSSRSVPALKATSRSLSSRSAAFRPRGTA